MCRKRLKINKSDHLLKFTQKASSKAGIGTYLICFQSCVLSFLINLFIYLFIHYSWLPWVFVAARGLSPVAASRGHSSLWCAGLSLQWLLLLRSTGSRRAGSRVVVAHGPSCSAACGIFPDQGSNPCSLHCQAGFLTTAPPGKPDLCTFNIHAYSSSRRWKHSNSVTHNNLLHIALRSLENSLKIVFQVTITRTQWNQPRL